MITIQFRDHSDALTVYYYLIDADRSQALTVSLIRKPEVLLKIMSVKKGSEFISILIAALTRYIMTDVEVKWMKEMIRSLFYYTDIEEQEQILSIARSILDGEKEDIPGLPHSIDNKSRKYMIHAAFSEFITASVSFSFESFLQFRLKQYRSRLLAYVESAIDEYKMEQEYQAFIESLRTYVGTKKPEAEKIYILHTDSFSLYDKQFRLIKQEATRHLINNEEVKTQIEIDSEVLEPLIALSPRTVYLYTNQSDSGIVRTIQNIFQERVLLFPENQFPHCFTRQIKQKGI